MLLLGVTGGVGMGKSTTAQFLDAAGVVVIDTDDVARQVVEPGQPALEEIRRDFGSAVIQPDGMLDRSALGRVVFSDPERRLHLESIVHPRIRSAWESRVAAWRLEGRWAAAVVIPLLFETGAESAFDSIFCVACTAETQWHRLRDRAWRREDIRNRIGAQKPVAEKMALAQVVIWTEGPAEVHRDQVMKALGRFGLPTAAAACA